jgi:phosphomannomutase
MAIYMDMASKKIVAFDLDGTLTVSKSRITDEMAHLVVKLGEKYIVVVTSGGSFDQFKTQFLPSFAKIDIRPEILRNMILLPTSGSQRYQYDEGSREWKRTYREPSFDEGVKQKAKTLLKEIIESGEYDIPKDPKGEYIEDRDTQISLSALGQDAPIEEKKLWDPDQKKRQKIKSELESKLPEATISIGGTTTIDILPKGFDKAKGLKLFLDELDMSVDDMVFVGDSIFPGGNDFSPSQAGIKCIKVSGPEDTASVIEGMI